MTLSFNHLVGAAKERKRHRKSKRLGGLEIDVQVDFSGLLDGHSGRLFAFEKVAQGHA